MTPIDGLTNTLKTGFVEIGRIRKGILFQPKDKKKKPYPKEVDYFRMVPNPDEEGLQELLDEIYSDCKGKPKQLQIYFPFPEIDRFWDANLECYKGSRMVARSDGVTFQYLVDSKTGQVIVRNGLDENGQPVLCDMSVNDGRGPVIYESEHARPKPYYLAPVGRLKIMIREIPRLAHFTLITGSRRDIKAISEELEGINQVAKFLGRPITGIPAIMKRRPEKINIIKDDGEALSTTKHFVHIETDPVWTAKIQIDMQNKSMAQISAGNSTEIPAEIHDGEFKEEEAIEEAAEKLLDEEAETTEPVITEDKDRPTSANDHDKYYKFTKEYMSRTDAHDILKECKGDTQIAFDKVVDMFRGSESK